jgi:hypothetical protein
MCGRLPSAILVVVFALTAAGGMACAGAPPPSCPHERAAYPVCVAWYAQPSNTPRYSGGYVGGGSACRGDPRCPEEGTWGWDYTGWRCLLPRVWLGWWHGRRYQGGTGAYTTDGPHVPDVFAVKLPNKRVKKRGCPGD